MSLTPAFLLLKFAACRTGMSSAYPSRPSPALSFFVPFGTLRTPRAGTNREPVPTRASVFLSLSFGPSRAGLVTVCNRALVPHARQPGLCFSVVVRALPIIRSAPALTGWSVGVLDRGYHGSLPDPVSPGSSHVYPSCSGGSLCAVGDNVGRHRG